jgi:hypothetical protein
MQVQRSFADADLVGEHAHRHALKAFFAEQLIGRIEDAVLNVLLNGCSYHMTEVIIWSPNYFAFLKPTQNFARKSNENLTSRHRS